VTADATDTGETAGQASENARQGGQTRIHSVSRASKILLAVAVSQNGLQAREVATRFDLALPTAYHLLATLTAEGLLHKDERRRYLLGPSAAVIAMAVGKDTSVPEYYLKPLRQLAAVTRETAYISAWRGGEIVVIATIEGAEAVRVAGLANGYGENIHARASGKLLLAFARDGVADEMLANMPLRKRTPNTITSRPELKRELRKIRQEGIAFDREEFLTGVKCVSAPIRQDGVVLACYTVSAPAERFTIRRDRIVGALLNAAHKASDIEG
jgi:DNA-binding IclR family transcriptional regulator